MVHLRNQHKQELERAYECANSGQEFIPLLYTSDKTRQIFSWLEMVILTLQPFSFCENKVIGRHTKAPCIDVDTLMAYMDDLTTVVEKKLAKMIPDSFALVFDGWTHVSTHYLSIFATWGSNEETGYEVALLGLSPLENEETLSAVEHENYITYVLNLFGKSAENVACVIADNNNTNKAVADAMGASFIGCASHRFNLAVQDIIEIHATVVDKVQTLMIKLRNLTTSAKLRRITGLNPVVRHHIRWNSTFKMLKRYTEIRDAIPKMNTRDINALMPTPMENEELDELYAILSDLNSVQIELQRNSTTMADVRVLFDAVIEKYPQTCYRLKPDAKIVKSPEFESAIVKVQNNERQRLSSLEKLSIQRLQTSPASPNQQLELEREEMEMSLAQRALTASRLKNNS